MVERTFAVKTDNEDDTKRKYIYQAIDECGKNHSDEKQTSPSNEGRIYEIPGTIINNFVQ